MLAYGDAAYGERVSDLLLVPSPLLGAAGWSPVAAVLGATVADLGGATTPDDVLAAVTSSAAGIGDLVLVAYSNAGLYAPLLADRLDARATVYVDAALAGRGADVQLGRAGFLDFLTGLADEDGLLPPWTRWWSDPSALFPDEESRAAVEAAQPRLPLSYFTSRVAVPAGWAERPSAYLAFGETYAEEAAFARAHGWPLTVLPGRHLHQLVAPHEVAAAIRDLVSRV